MLLACSAAPMWPKLYKQLYTTTVERYKLSENMQNYLQFSVCCVLVNYSLIVAVLRETFFVFYRMFLLQKPNFRLILINAAFHCSALT